MPSLALLLRTAPESPVCISSEAYDTAYFQWGNCREGVIMAMERYSILVGNCYLDSVGVIYEVKSIQEGQTTVLIYQDAATGGQLKQETTMLMKDFLDDLQGQVPCPGSTAYE
jgi:hypothetical protein